MTEVWGTAAFVYSELVESRTACSSSPAEMDFGRGHGSAAQRRYSETQPSHESTMLLHAHPFAGSSDVLANSQSLMPHPSVGITNQTAAGIHHDRTHPNRRLSNSLSTQRSAHSNVRSNLGSYAGGFSAHSALPSELGLPPSQQPSLDGAYPSTTHLLAAAQPFTEFSTLNLPPNLGIHPSRAASYSHDRAPSALPLPPYGVAASSSLPRRRLQTPSDRRPANSPGLCMCSPPGPAIYTAHILTGRYMILIYNPPESSL